MSEENNNAKMSEAESPADGNKELSEHARDLGPRHEVRGVGRSLARGHGHHTLRQAGTDGGLAAGPVRVFLQALHAQRQETLAPAENFFGVIAMLAAISLSDWPEAASNTMRAAPPLAPGEIGSGLGIPIASFPPNST